MKAPCIRLRTVSIVLLLILLLSMLPDSVANAADVTPISLTALDSAYTQDFDTLSATAGATTNDLSIPGWALTESGGGGRDNEQYGVDTGSSTTGDTYSYGAAGSTERALGSLRSGTLVPIYGAAFTNNTGQTITSLIIAYTGEQWRLGTAARTDRLFFEYSLDATSLATGTWTNVADLNFITPNTATTGAKDGNAAAYRTPLTGGITGLTLADGATFWIRWSDTDASGADDGLAVDDFSITPTNLPLLSINNVSLAEGSSGPTTFSFSVSLSAPAGPGGVSFDIASADGTAAQPGDYIAKSLTGQSIPAGSSAYTFNVQVNGEVTPELPETFYVNVTNVSGAITLDGQGLGTITNDDPAPNLSINDVTLAEGNSGTTTFSFTVTLSGAASIGDVSFDIATADGTALAPSDYSAKSESKTIQLDSSYPATPYTYTFDVQVNGDSQFEPNDTFYVNISNITNAIPVDVQGVGTITNDDKAFIHEIQGSGTVSPLVKYTATIEGVVTASFQGTNQLQGFFLQEEDAQADADPLTSEGIFVYCGSCATKVAEGQLVRATGSISEFNGMTEISTSGTNPVVVVDAGNHLSEVTPAVVPLPITGDADAFYEAREGMLVKYEATLTVSEYFELTRYGQIVLYQGERPLQYTETSAPDAAGYSAYQAALARRRVVLDDDSNKQNAALLSGAGSQFIYYPQANGGLSAGTQGSDFFRGGDLVNGLTGVLDYYDSDSDNPWHIRPTTTHPVTFTPANPRPDQPPQVSGSIKAVGMNLLNYFTTIDTTPDDKVGTCGPSGTLDCRGADSTAELNRQRERVSNVICTLNADVYGLLEVENTTRSDTITDLLGAVNTRCGSTRPYTFVDTGGTLGTDAIRVMIIYRPATLAPVGAPLVDMNTIHSRPPTAQTFKVVDPANPYVGQSFTVVANHLKSKGCDGAAGADTDARDGQGCFNDRRTQQAARLLTWLKDTVIPAAGNSDVLLLGDFNSYTKEDPIITLAAGGFTDMTAALLGHSSYSYLFDSQLGHLDYGLASSSLAPKIKGIANWHINADEVDLFDYNDEVKDAGEADYEQKPNGTSITPPRVLYEAGTPYRASDHDPVIIGLDLDPLPYKQRMPIIGRH